MNMELPVTSVNQHLNSLDKYIAVFIFFLCLACGLSQAVFGVSGVYHDDGIYVATAKALAEGEGYRLINLPDAPPQTKYPVLYPALLATIWKLVPSFPANIVIMQCVNIMLCGISFAICYIFMVRFNYFKREIAFMSVLLCTFSPSIIYFATINTSEMLFLLLSVTMMWVLESTIAENSVKRLKMFFVGVLIALPFLCRTIGIVYIPVALFIWYAHKLPLRWIILGTLSVLLPYILWILFAYSGNTNPDIIYYTDYMQWFIKYFKENVLFIPFFNFIWIHISIPCIVWGELLLPFIKQYGFYGTIFIFFPGFLTIMVMLFEKNRTILKYCVLASVAIIIIWPWPPQRFIIPIAPFIVAYMLYAIYLCVYNYLSRRIITIAVLSAMMITLTFNIYILYELNYEKKQFYYPFYSISQIDELAAWSSYKDMFEWLKANSHSSDIIACGLDSMIYLYTDRRAFRPFVSNPVSLFYGGSSPKVGSTDDFMKLMKAYRPRYLVDLPMPTFAEYKPFQNLLNIVKKKYPDYLIRRYSGNDKRFIIYEVRYDIDKSPKLK